MPRGANRTGNFSHGNPVTLPKNFGTPIDTTTHEFGNVIDSAPSPENFGNDVTWKPDPAHFGNQIEEE
jgi:hypothetical protein